MSNPVISVIIPAYNCEKYINRAANSVLSQPCSEKIELIIVDDGSTDSTGSIIDTLAKEHQNVRAIHKRNGGVSSARNTGIEVASGHYLAFLDADDWWSTGVFDDELIALIVKEPTDLCAFGMRKVSTDMKFYQEMSRDEAVYFGDEKATLFLHVCYLYRMSFIQQNGLRYPSAKYGEDPVFAEMSTFHSKSTRCINKILYNYWMNTSSALHQGKSALVFTESMKSLAEKKQLFAESDAAVIDREIISTIVALLPRLCVENNFKTVKSITEKQNKGCELLYQDTILPWKALQHSFRLWQFSPALFYLKSQFHPGIVLRVKNILYKNQTTQRFADWLQYRVIEKWQKLDFEE